MILENKFLKKNIWGKKKRIKLRNQRIAVQLKKEKYLIKVKLMKKLILVKKINSISLQLTRVMLAKLICIFKKRLIK
jgi:hypothetical protein